MDQAKPTKRTPYNWAKFDRTYNNAIDLVAQCVGFNRARRRPIRAIILKPTYYALFKTGTEVLMKKRIEDPATELLFDGVKILCGSNLQWENMIVEYHGRVNEIKKSDA